MRVLISWVMHEPCPQGPGYVKKQGRCDLSWRQRLVHGCFLISYFYGIRRGRQWASGEKTADRISLPPCFSPCTMISATGAARQRRNNKSRMPLAPDDPLAAGFQASCTTSPCIAKAPCHVTAKSRARRQASGVRPECRLQFSGLVHSDGQDGGMTLEEKG